MKELFTERCLVKLLSIEQNIKLDCNKESCSYFDNETFSSWCPRKKLFIGNEAIKINVARVIVKNIWDKPVMIDTTQFEIIDSLGFAHPAVDFCDKYYPDKRFVFHRYEILPGSQMYYLIVTNEIDEGATISKIGFTDFSSSYFIIIDEKEKEVDIEELIVENERLKKENEKLKERQIRQSNDSIKYITKQDDEYFYIICDDDEETIAFNREFDKSKENYNWINTGDPLITLRFENTPTINRMSNINPESSFRYI